MTATRVIVEHSDLDGVGTKTHDQIDTHINSTTFIVVSGTVPPAGRRLAAGSGVTITDGGPGGDLTLNLSGSGTPIPAAQIGQVLFSTDGATFSANLPVTHPDYGWLMQDNGIFIVVG